MNPINYTKCPWCQSRETIARKMAAAGFAKFPEGVVPHLKVEVNLIQEPVVGLTAPGAVRLVDQCAGCGREYVAHVEFQRFPINMAPPASRAEGGYPKA